MYPSDSAPNYGVFVQNTEKILVDAGMNVDRTVMFKHNGKLRKLISYIRYYAEILLKGLSNTYDVTYVHYASHNAIPLLLLKRLKKQTIIYTNVHGSDVVPEVPSQEKYQNLVKKLLMASNIIITPSHYYRKLVKSKYGISNQIEVFPSGGINPVIFYDNGNQQETKTKLHLDLGKKYIGFVGRLDVGKGWDVLLDAFHSLNQDGTFDDLSLLVVGDGKERSQFEAKVAEYGLSDKIVHYPLLPQEKLNLIYNAIDVFCFPTTRKGESLGLVGLEAMACGAPIIGSSIGGLLDYIKDGDNGYLFQPGASDELTASLEKFFVLSSTEREQLGIRAKQTAKAYEVETIKQKLIDIFESSSIK